MSMEMHMGNHLNQTLNQEQIERTAPVATHLRDEDVSAIDIWHHEIVPALEQGQFILFCFVGEPASGKGQLLREFGTLIHRQSPDTRIHITTLAAEATKVEQEGLAPAAWETWEPSHFALTSERMAEHVYQAYQGYLEAAGAEAVLSEFVGILPPMNAGNSIIEVGKNLAEKDERVQLIILASVTDNAVWEKEYARRKKIEQATTPEEVAAIDKEARVRRVDLRGRRVTANPRVIEKESGSSAAIARVRGIINMILINEYPELKKVLSDTGTLPESITVDDLEYADLRERLLKAHIRQVIASWNLPNQTIIFVARNTLLDKTIPWHVSVYNNIEK